MKDLCHILMLLLCVAISSDTAHAYKISAKQIYAPPPRPAQPVHLVPQKMARLDITSRVTGAHTIYICDMGFKDINLENGVVTVCCPPDWSIFTYNPATHLIFRQPFDTYEGFLLKDIATWTGHQINDKRVSFDNKTEYLGQSAKHYQTGPEVMKEARRRIAAHEARDGEPGFVESTNISLPYKTDNSLHAERLLKRMYGLPEAQGLPVYVKYKRVSGDDCEFYKTRSIALCRLDPAAYKIPADYKASATIQNVINSQNASSAADLMEGFSDLGI